MSAASLPISALWLAFAASTSWILFQAFIAIEKILTPARLDFTLTNSIFWRLTLQGEAFFPNSVAFSSNGPCQISDVDFVLEHKAEQGSVKRFPIRFESLGLLLPTASRIHGEHHFFSASPINFIPENTVERNVMMCVLADYDSKVAQAFESYGLKLQEMRRDLAAKYPVDIKPDEAQEINLIDNLRQVVEDTTKKVLGAVQMEPGDYTLTCTVHYTGRAGAKWKKPRTSTSSISFTVDLTFRDKLEADVQDMLANMGRAHLFGTDLQSSLPEYAPRIARPKPLFR